MKLGRVRQAVEQYEQIVEDHLMDLQVNTIVYLKTKIQTSSLANLCFLFCKL